MSASGSAKQRILFPGGMFLTILLLLGSPLLGGVSDSPVSSGPDAAALTFSFKGGRFYHAALVRLPQLPPLIVAAGQKDDGETVKFKAYLAVFTWENGAIKPLTAETFAVEHKGKPKQSRIRTVAVSPAAHPSNPSEADVWVVGKGGGDDEGVGFLKRFRFNGQKLIPGETAIISNAGAAYTHGYPLKTADLDNDGTMEIIYGGFSGDEESGDMADIRIFRPSPNGGVAEDPVKPFSDLTVLMRVNAMETGDIDGDGRTDIVIAGRTKEGQQEFPSFAWFSNGKSAYEIIKTGLPGRLRTLLIADPDQDGKNELITGGRVDTPSYWAAMLTAWKITDGRASSTGRYYWTGEGNIRLRALSSPGGSRRILAAGRYEWKDSAQTLRWLGFHQFFTLTPHGLFPDSLPVTMDSDFETRVRSLEFIGGNQYLGAGFTEDKDKNSSGFISILTF